MCSFGAGRSRVSRRCGLLRDVAEDATVASRVKWSRNPSSAVRTAVATSCSTAITCNCQSSRSSSIYCHVFCNTNCRKAAWRERHREDNAHNTDVVSNIVPGVPAVSTAFPDDVPNHGGQHRCPHCRQRLAVISVIIPADAAVIRPPEVPALTSTRHPGKMI